MKPTQIRKRPSIASVGWLLFLTACAPIASPPAPASSSKSATSSVQNSAILQTSSAATSSSKYAPTVHYMNYEEYFSRDRAIDMSGWGKYRSELESMHGPYFQKDGILFSPCPAEYGTYAETQTGLLLLAGGRVYEATEPNKPARLVYEPKLPYIVTRLYTEADAHIFYAELREQNNPDKFKVCRFFRYTGKEDILATDEDIPGSLTELHIHSNTRIHVISHMPYDQSDGAGWDELENRASRARRQTFIDTVRGIVINDEDDPEGYEKAIAQWIEDEKREAEEANASSK